MAVTLSKPLLAQNMTIEAMPAPGVSADQKPAPLAQNQGRAPAGGSTDAAQAEFVTKAGEVLHASADLAGLAQDKSADPAVQDLSRQIGAEDGKLLTAMTGLVTQAVPPNLGPAYAAQVQSLEHVPSGDLFDDQYAPLQASLAQQLAAMFQTESQTGSGPLKDLAAAELPTLQQDASQMQALKKPQP